MLFSKYQDTCLWTQALLIMHIKTRLFQFHLAKPYRNLHSGFPKSIITIEKGDKILEIGTGSGYQAAVLCEMGVKLYTIERIKELYRKTSMFLPYQLLPKEMIYGDGYRVT